MKQPTITIRYEKKFLSGLLMGLTVPQEHTVLVESAPRYVEYLERCTEASPGRDLITNDRYAIDRIQVQQ